VNKTDTTKYTVLAFMFLEMDLMAVIENYLDFTAETLLEFL
jgi:hypothetical protein